jgi:hypothetical protein
MIPYLPWSPPRWLRIALTVFVVVTSCASCVEHETAVDMQTDPNVDSAYRCQVFCAKQGMIVHNVSEFTRSFRCYCKYGKVVVER